MQTQVIRNTERVDALAWLVMVNDGHREWLEESFATKKMAQAYARDYERGAK